jgi:hypothetical protein
VLTLPTLVSMAAGQHASASPSLVSTSAFQPVSTLFAVGSSCIMLKPYARRCQATGIRFGTGVSRTA